MSWCFYNENNTGTNVKMMPEWAGTPLAPHPLFPTVWDLHRLSGSPWWIQHGTDWTSPSPLGSLLPPTWNRELELRDPAGKTTSNVVFNSPKRTRQNAWARGQRCSHLGHDEAVIVEVARIIVAILHGVEKQHRHDLCHAAAWCWVSGSRNKGVHVEKNPKYKVKQLQLEHI